MSYDNTNRGQIWRNEKKQDDKHPDFTGSLNIDGVEYWVNAWKRKEGANPRSPALSFSVRRKDDQQHGQSRGQSYGDMKGKSKPRGAGPFSDDMNDTIPFALEYR